MTEARKVVLYLGVDTSDTHCGACPGRIAYGPMSYDYVCDRFKLKLRPAATTRAILRLDACKAAELPKEDAAVVRRDWANGRCLKCGSNTCGPDRCRSFG